MGMGWLDMVQYSFEVPCDDVPFVSFVTLCAPLWIKLCDHFVPLCAFVIILCDIIKYNLIG
jgi:hypothetical protein